MSSDGINDFSENISSIETAKDYNDTKEIEEIVLFDNCWYFPLFFLIFPPFFIQMSLAFPVKALLRIDKVNKLLIYTSKNIYGCETCCFRKRILDLSQIKKCKLYLFSYPSRSTAGFDIRMNCDVESTLGFRDILFSAIKYDPRVYKQIGETLKKYVDTEIQNLETNK